MRCKACSALASAHPHHVLENEKKLVVLTDDLLELHNARMVQLAQGAHLRRVGISGSAAAAPRFDEPTLPHPLLPDPRRYHASILWHQCSRALVVVG